MTDHTTSTTTRSSLRRALRGAAAVATAVVPLALGLGAASPAAADPGPLSLTGDGCTVHYQGEGYGTLRISLTHNGRTSELTSTVNTWGSAEYGLLWLLPAGEVATVTLDGLVAGQVVASTTMEIGTCTGVFDASVVVSVSKEGAPEPASSYAVELRDCSGNGGFRFAPVVTLGAGGSAEVPVIPTRSYCASVVEAPDTVLDVQVTGSPVTPGYGGRPTIALHVVHADRAVEEPAVEPPAEEAPPAPEAPTTPDAEQPSESARCSPRTWRRSARSCSTS